MPQITYNPPVASRFLALDIGDVRTGLALSDATGALAFPAGVVAASDAEELAAALSASIGALKASGRIAPGEALDALIVGVPLGESGGETERSRKVCAWGEAVAVALGLPVHFVDERYSTRRMIAADRESGRNAKRGKENMDARAAAEILQGFLDVWRTSRNEYESDASDEADKGSRDER